MVAAKTCRMAILGAVLFQIESGAAVIHLKNRTISADGRREIATLPLAGAGQHWILQFPRYPDAAIRAELIRRGARILDYVPDAALMVSFSRTPDLTGQQVVWAGQLEPRDRQSAGLDRARAFLVIFHRDVALGRAIELLASFQMLEAPGLLPNHYLVAANHGALPALAERDEVAFIMPAETDMGARRRQYVCPGPLTEAGVIAEYATSGAGWSKDSSGAVSIGYRFDDFTAKIDQNTQAGQIALAFAQWMKYANVTVAPVAQPAQPRSADLLFGTYSHGDPYPFDGPGGVLAHTFYPFPLNNEPLAGDMHFDDSESWGVGTGIDLFSVALHEAGHALGLAHSTNTSAVMYPYYRQQTGLTSDDIAAIQSLYGAASSTTTQPTPAPDPTPTLPVRPTQPSQPVPPAQPPTPVPPSTPDTIPPSLAILYPGSSIVSAYSNTIAFSGAANDNVGVTTVKWTTSTGGSGTASGTTQWSAAIPLLMGTNVVTVRAYDAAGNSGWRAVTVVRSQ
jgi:hypothetical protein